MSTKENAVRHARDEERNIVDRRPRYTRYAEQMLRQGYALTINHDRKTATFRRSTDAGYYTIPHRAAVEALGGVDSELLERVVEIGKRPAAPEPPPPSPYEVKPKAKKKKKKPDPKPAPAPKPVRAQTPKEAPPQEEIMITKTVALEKKRYLVRELADLMGFSRDVVVWGVKQNQLTSERKGDWNTAPIEVLVDEKLIQFCRKRGVEIEQRWQEPQKAEVTGVSYLIDDVEVPASIVDATTEEELKEFGLRAVAGNVEPAIQSLNGKRAHADRPVIRRSVELTAEGVYGRVRITDGEGGRFAQVEMDQAPFELRSTAELRALSALLEAAAKEMEGQPNG